MKRLLLLACMLAAAGWYYRRDQVARLAQDTAAVADEALGAAPAKNTADVPECTAEQKQAGCLRVLFVGNSYTYYNKLPDMLSKLAASANRTVIAGFVATGGMSLAEHLRQQKAPNAIKASHWDYVVLQEQSQVPAVPAQRETQMYPAAMQLAAMAQLAGAKPILYLTWGRKDGWPENGMPTYTAMQDEINRGYVQLRSRLVDTPIAPVGPAWASVTREHPEITLWDSDGSHPKAAGTYLAASVFYATIFNVSPRGLSFVPKFVTRDEAVILQTAATDAVLNPARAWERP